MATYTTQALFEAYSEGWVTTDPNALERLLLRAEQDVDRLLYGSGRNNAVRGIAVDNSTLNGNDFALTWEWLGVTYTTPARIPVTVSASVFLTNLNGMKDQYGNVFPGTWVQPDVRNSNQPWAYGPLPGTPIVFEASNMIAQQNLEQFTTDNPGVTITEIVAGGLRVNPYLVSPVDAQVISNATCAQAEYRNIMGDDFFIRAQYTEVSGPEFRTRGKMPLVGPKVFWELRGTDLLIRGARARPGTGTRRQTVYVPIGTTPIPDDWRAL